MSNIVAQAMKLADLPETRHFRHEAHQFSNDESGKGSESVALRLA